MNALHPTARRFRTLLAGLLLTAILPAPSTGASIFDEASSLDKDAYVHFSAGVLISHVSYPLFNKQFRDSRKAMWYALGLTAALALGKEICDRDTTGFSGSDLAAGLLGGCTIFVVTF